VPIIKKLAAKILLALGYSIRSSTKKTLIQRLWTSSSQAPISTVQKRTIMKHSKSQLGQDILGLSAAGLGRPGYFVEFGASDGVALSNTHMLEKQFGWSGILCEPSKSWHQALRKNRGCVIDIRCVYSTTGEKIGFSENYLGELSSITKFAETNSNGLFKRTTSSYEVETISLIDLLDFYNAPKHIDFLSVDTEGSEFEILEAFDFQKYSFGVICVEHNFADTREKINRLLLANGYKPVQADLSDFDDWYIQGRN